MIEFKKKDAPLIKNHHHLFQMKHGLSIKWIPIQEHKSQNALFIVVKNRKRPIMKQTVKRFKINKLIITVEWKQPLYIEFILKYSHISIYYHKKEISVRIILIKNIAFYNGKHV